MTKEDWRFIFDILSSVASVIAIGAALLALYRSSRNPLRVYRTLIHWDLAKQRTTIFLYVRNAKDYPVFLNTVDCYKQKTFVIERRRGDSPRFSAIYLGADQVFQAKPREKIPANADMCVALEREGILNLAPRLLYLLDTSHGQHEVWCKDVMPVDVGRVKTEFVEYRFRLHKRWPAILLYQWKKLVHALRPSDRVK